MESESPLNWDKIMEPVTSMVPVTNNLLDSDSYNDLHFNYTILLTFIIIILCLLFCLLLYNNNNISNKSIFNNRPTPDDDDMVAWN